ncbi:hypothetical protein R6G00_25710, partial [Streptomyces roseofulvus]|nr:hypothetical protein [Streptomyces roseolus]
AVSTTPSIDVMRMPKQRVPRAGVTGAARPSPLWRTPPGRLSEQEPEPAVRDLLASAAGKTGARDRREAARAARRRGWL